MKMRPHPALAHGKVRHVGDPVAVVVAETLRAGEGRGREGRGRLRGAAGGRRSGQGAVGRRAAIHDVAPNNTIYRLGARRQGGDRRGVQGGAATSPSSTSSTTGWCRTRSSRAPRSATTTPAPTAYTLWTTIAEPARRAARDRGLRRHGAGAQAARRSRPTSAAASARRSSSIAEEVVVPLGLASSVGRPVKWTADRTRSLPLRRAWPRPRHARRAGARRRRQDPRRCGSRRSPTSAPTCRPSRRRCRPISTRRCCPASTRSPAIYCEVNAVYTNTAPVDAYRGAGRPEATFVVERLVEVGGARARASTRPSCGARNFIKTLPAPDAGDHDLRRRRLRRVARRRRWSSPTYKGFGKRKARVERAAASCAASAISTYIEACGIAPSQAVGSLGAGVGLWESAEVRVNPTGTVEVLTGSHSHGQGHETTFAQLVSERLGIPIDERRDRPRRHRQGAVRHGHLRLALRRGRHVGDRQGARQDRGQGQEDRRASARGRRRRHRVQGRQVHGRRHRQGEGAAARSRSTPTSPHNFPARELEPGLKESAFYDPTNFTFPAGCHICEVEIDPGDRQRRDRAAGSRSTISATSSIR